VEHVLGGLGQLVESHFSTMLCCFASVECWCQAMNLLFVCYGRWSGSQRRPCMLDGGKHLTEMELNW
jgi:hypothetical protein